MIRIRWGQVVGQGSAGPRAAGLGWRGGEVRCGSARCLVVTEMGIGGCQRASGDVGAAAGARAGVKQQS